MGAKLLWNLLAPKPSWCSRVLKAKYFRGLDGGHVTKSRSSIFNVCSKALPQFKEELYWVPGNGRSTNLWHDRILGKTPPQTPCLQHWLVAMGVNTIWDIYNWEPEEPNRWAG